MDDTELAAAVRAVGVFADLSDESVAFLISSATREIFAPQDVIVRQGALDEDAVLIVAGEAIVTSDSAHGEIPVSTVRGPALVGEIGAIARLPRTATVRARSEVLALRIARDDLMRVAEATPSMLVGVISRLGDRIGRMGNAIALYTHALAALERQDAEANVLLEELRNPIPDLADFAETFSRIAEQILLRRQRSDEMAAAAIVQRALLPNAEDFASETGVDIAAAMTPARDIGGDFFDLMKLEDGRIALGIGDVCGKGVPAALFMGITKSLIRINLREKPDLPGAIARANAFLINNNASDQFATALYAALDPATGEVEYCSCGHNAAFIRREGGTVERLPGGGLPIGVFADLRLKVRRAALAPGDVLFLYTDGLTEANDGNGEEFGEGRLSAIIAGANESAGDWVARAIAEVREFSRGLAPFDDLTCLAVRR